MTSSAAMSATTGGVTVGLDGVGGLIGTTGGVIDEALNGLPGFTLGE